MKFPFTVILTSYFLNLLAFSDVLYIFMNIHRKSYVRDRNANVNRIQKVLICLVQKTTNCYIRDNI